MQQELILAKPECMSWIDSVIQDFGWFWVGAINVLHEVITNEKSIKLCTPGEIVHGCEFEGQLCSSIDCNQ